MQLDARYFHPILASGTLTDMTLDGPVGLLLLFAVLGAIGAGLIAGGWGRVAALAIIGGFIGARVAASLSLATVGEPEELWNIVFLGFLLGMIPGAWFGKLLNWAATRHGRHAVSPRSRMVIKTLTIIAAAVVVVFLGEEWQVTDLVN